MSSTDGSSTSHGREAPRERAVALDLAVLGQRRGADHAQLAAGEQRLEHVGGVHRALGVAGAEDRVQLVDEQHDLALGVDGLLERGLQALLELAAELGAGDHAGQVERDDARAAQRLGHVALGDAQREALDDGGLADAGLADQHGVVLAPAREDLDGLLDLVVAADHGVDAALARPRRSGRGRTRRAPGVLDCGVWGCCAAGPNCVPRAPNGEPVPAPDCIISRCAHGSHNPSASPGGAVGDDHLDGGGRRPQAAQRYVRNLWHVLGSV